MDYTPNEPPNIGEEERAVANLIAFLSYGPCASMAMAKLGIYCQDMPNCTECRKRYILAVAGELNA